MPFVTIRYVGENLASEADTRKKAIADKVSKALSDEMGVASNSVSVVFEAVPASDWFVGPISVRESRP